MRRDGCLPYLSENPFKKLCTITGYMYMKHSFKLPRYLYQTIKLHFKVTRRHDVRNDYLSFLQTYEDTICQLIGELNYQFFDEILILEWMKISFMTYESFIHQLCNQIIPVWAEKDCTQRTFIEYTLDSLTSAQSICITRWHFVKWFDIQG